MVAQTTYCKNHRRSRSHPDRRDDPAVAERGAASGTEALRHRRSIRHARRCRQRLSAFPARRLGPGTPAAGYGRLQGRRAGAVGLPADLRLCAAAGAGGGVRPHPERAARQAGQGSSRPLSRHRRRCPCRRPSRRRTSFATPCAKLGLRGAQIGSNVAGKNLDDPELEPVWATAAELDAFILLHPINVAGVRSAVVLLSHQSDRQSARYHHRRRMPGVQRRARALSVAEDSASPMAAVSCRTRPGRFVHGWQVRTEPKNKLPKPPTDSLKRFYFDTIVHSKDAA